MEPARTERDSTWFQPRWFRPALGLVVVAALALRVVYVLVSRRNFDPHGDAYFYHAGANLLADGKGFLSPFFVQLGLHRAAAGPPPLSAVFRAVPAGLGAMRAHPPRAWSVRAGSGRRAARLRVWPGRVGGRTVGIEQRGAQAVWRRGSRRGRMQWRR